MGADQLSSSHMTQTRFTLLVAALALLMGCLTGCESGGDSNLASAPSTPTPRVEAQAVDNLLDLYAQALRQEDIDRLQPLLQPEPLAAPTTRQAAVPQQAADGTFADLAAFRRTLADTFRSHAVTDHAILPHTIQVASDYTQVDFVEVESVSNPLFRFHHSRVYETTLTLRRTATGEAVQFRIRGVRREGPIVEIATQGQLQAGVRSRVEVAASQARFDLDRVEIVDPATGEIKPLRATADGLERAFTASDRVAALRVRLHDRSGELLEVFHPYQARSSGDRVVVAVPGTGGTKLLAITTASDGTVWAGGDRGARLYRVGSGTAQAELVRPLIADPAGRLEDLVMDALGRLHAVVFSPQRSGVIVRDQDTFCQTVNVLDETYPLRDVEGQPSVSTRAVSASSGAIWLLGSDAGVVQVSDGFRNGQCPATGVEVQYTSLLRREDGVIPVNTVPALEVADDGALWIGSALGLGRLKDGQLTQVPFDPQLSFQGNAATLETFFQNVAQAIFEARPVESVAVGDVSFVEAFGSALVKEDIVFSLAEDHQGRLWIGTLGGGIRRVEVRGDRVEQTLHVTREDGLASNIIFTLAIAPDGAIWAASDDGVSRIESHGNEVTVTTYTVLDGLALPARDVAVDAQGTAWVATDEGIFRIQSLQGQIAGQVQDANAQPVADAEVILHGTSVRTVSDAQGQYAVGAIAPGTYLLEVNGRTSTTGEWGGAFREIVVGTDSQTLAPLVLRPPATRQPVDVVQGGLITFANVPGASLDVPPQSAQFPAGAASMIGLTQLPVGALARPLPSGFDGIVAAQLLPRGLTFEVPARLALPTSAQVEAGQLLLLMCFDEATGGYEQLGLGRVSADGTVIEPLSGGLRACSTVVYAAAGEDAIRLFLVPVSGNNQRAQPGEELPEPLVVRLEDQFGNPVSGQLINAVMTQGEASFVAADVETNAQGEASFRIIAEASEDDLAVQMTVPDIPDTRPVQFFVIIGELDTPDNPYGVAVADGVAYVANDRFGLLVVDVHDATRPELLHAIPFTRVGNRESIVRVQSVAVQERWAYVGVSNPIRLYVLDISDPYDPRLSSDVDDDGVPDAVVGRQDFPDTLPHHLRLVVAQGNLVYAVSTILDSDPASLYVVNVQNSTAPELVSRTPLPVSAPAGLAVAGNFVYIPAGETGLLVFDVRQPSVPTLVHTLSDPDPEDEVAVRYDSQIAISGEMAYLVETERVLATEQDTDRLAVLDRRTPAAPKWRGRAPLTDRSHRNTLSRLGLAVNDAFAYVARGLEGLEVVDIRDPDAPRSLSLINTPSATEHVTIAETVLYTTDTLFTLQVIQGPGAVTLDTDSDGLIDFFDAFPIDPTETADSDGDRIGDQADPDDDNDGFSDAEEAAATPPTSATNPLDFPVVGPPVGATAILVDATVTLNARARQGTEAAPYRSVTEALRALHSGLAPDVETLRIRAGIYSTTTTGEIIPIDLGGLSNLALQAEVPGSVVLDGGFQGEVVNAAFSENLVLEGLVVTQGIDGIRLESSAHITLRNNQVRGHGRRGIYVTSSTEVVIADNLIEDNLEHGILLIRNPEALVTRNLVRNNGEHGINNVFEVTATIAGNVAEHNGRTGINSFSDATLIIRENVTRFNGAGIWITTDSSCEMHNNLSEHNDFGIAVIVNSNCILTQNTARLNGWLGITISDHSTAELRDNTVVDNGDLATDPFGFSMGIAVAGGSMATISGGVVSGSDHDGIYLGPASLQPEPGIARIGLDGDSPVEISNNGGAGIFVENNGSEAIIDSRNIIFSNNVEGDTAGNVIDIAP